MKGDWTNRDPAITQALAAFGRAGVPLYVVYNAKPGCDRAAWFCRRSSPPASCKVRSPTRRGHNDPNGACLQAWPSDNATTISVIDFRRHSMVLQWHALGGTWTACDTPPALVHGIALIRASRTQYLRVWSGRALAPAGRPESIRVGGKFAAHQLHARLGQLRISPALHRRDRAPAACCSAIPIGPIKARISYRWLADKAEDPDWRVTSGRQWSEGVLRRRCGLTSAQV